MKAHTLFHLLTLVTLMMFSLFSHAQVTEFTTDNEFDFVDHNEWQPSVGSNKVFHLVIRATDVGSASFSVPIDVSEHKSATVQILSTTDNLSSGALNGSASAAIYAKAGPTESSTSYVTITPTRSPVQTANAELTERGLYHYDLEAFSLLRLWFTKPFFGGQSSVLLSIRKERAP